MRAVVPGHVGVDLRGDDAEAVLASAQPMIAWLEEREPGVVVRSISVNDARILVSLAAEPKPRALRIEDAGFRSTSEPVAATLTPLVGRALSRRA